MLNLSIFAERLCELMVDNNVNTDKMIQITGVNRTSINRYLAGKCFPSVKVLVVIADYFKCTLDFLLGKEDENYFTKSKTCPDFCEQLKFLINKKEVSKYRLCKEGRITESTLYYWLKGTHVPRISDIEKLAKYFDYSIDYVVGRGD